MYNCGPTVYDYAHIGNLRSFLFADLLRRYLEYSDFKVKQVMNITDVGHMLEDADVGEDKVEQAAKKMKKTPKQITEFYTKAFFRDIEKLNILKAEEYPKATEHVKEMIKIIEKLIKNGYAYEVNGSVYFDLEKFKKFGKLSGNKMKDLIAGARVDVNPDKKHPYDFVLWIHNPKHLMQWQSPWGKGYPGWHIECSAMANKYLGKTIDIHTGGEDNKFPHHECEIAQSECANGVDFSRFWLHTKHLLVEGKKMSKSKGNFYTLEDLLNKGYSARAIRYLLLSTRYRDSLNFTFKGLDDAEISVKKIFNTYTRLLKNKTHNEGYYAEGEERSFGNFKTLIRKQYDNFMVAMDDDLNVSSALKYLFYFLHIINWELDRGMKKEDKKGAINLLLKIDSIFGFGINAEKVDKIPEKVLKLSNEREKARKEKNWKESDELREEIRKTGYEVEDASEGTVIKKVRLQKK